MQNISTHNDASVLAKKIIDSLSQTIYIDEHKLNVSASIGVSFYPQSSSDPQELLKYADIAMYEAKAMGRNNFQLYTDKLKH